MDIQNIIFPLEGSIQNYLNFFDKSRKYVFSFASPFIYPQPVALKKKEAFILGQFDPFGHSETAPEAIHSYFFADKKKSAWNGNKKANASMNQVFLFNGLDEKIGSIEILTARTFFLRFAKNIPNAICDAQGKTIGFCHFQAAKKRKAVYRCLGSFPEINQPLREEQLDQYENSGRIALIYTYDVFQYGGGMKKVMDELFSPAKKSEGMFHRIEKYTEVDDQNSANLLLSALFAFFWSTFIDNPTPVINLASKK